MIKKIKKSTNWCTFDVVHALKYEYKLQKVLQEKKV